MNPLQQIAACSGYREFPTIIHYTRGTLLEDVKLSDISLTYVRKNYNPSKSANMKTPTLRTQIAILQEALEVANATIASQGTALQGALNERDYLIANASNLRDVVSNLRESNYRKDRQIDSLREDGDAVRRNNQELGVRLNQAMGAQAFAESRASEFLNIHAELRSNYLEYQLACTTEERGSPRLVDLQKKIARSALATIQSEQPRCIIARD